MKETYRPTRFPIALAEAALKGGFHKEVLVYWVARYMYHRRGGFMYAGEVSQIAQATGMSKRRVVSLIERGIGYGLFTQTKHGWRANALVKVLYGVSDGEWFSSAVADFLEDGFISTTRQFKAWLLAIVRADGVRRSARAKWLKLRSGHGAGKYAKPSHIFRRDDHGCEWSRDLGTWAYSLTARSTGLSIAEQSRLTALAEKQGWLKREMKWNDKFDAMNLDYTGMRLLRDSMVQEEEYAGYRDENGGLSRNPKGRWKWGKDEKDGDYKFRYLNYVVYRFQSKHVEVYSAKGLRKSAKDMLNSNWYASSYSVVVTTESITATSYCNVDTATGVQ